MEPCPQNKTRDTNTRTMKAAKAAPNLLTVSTLVFATAIGADSVTAAAATDHSSVSLRQQWVSSTGVTTREGAGEGRAVDSDNSADDVVAATPGRSRRRLASTADLTTTSKERSSSPRSLGWVSDFFRKYWVGAGNPVPTPCPTPLPTPAPALKTPARSPANPVPMGDRAGSNSFRTRGGTTPVATPVEATSATVTAPNTVAGVESAPSTQPSSWVEGEDWSSIFQQP